MVADGTYNFPKIPKAVWTHDTDKLSSVFMEYTIMF
jgi:hypothetical protein